MNLFITQKSFFFVIKNFIQIFESYECQIIFVEEKSRGLFRKYKEIIYNFGFIDFCFLVILEIKYWLIYKDKIKNFSCFTTLDKDLNNKLDFILSKNKYKKVFSIGCPTKLNKKLSEKYSIPFYNLHGGIIPFQKGRFSPLKGIKFRHKYLGATLHKITDTFDEGDIESQICFKLEKKGKIYNYNKVIMLSSKILNKYIKGEKQYLSQM